MTSYERDNPELAETYDRLSDMQFEGGKRLVERMGIKPGDHVLDIGCGTGRLTQWIAKRVGPSGSVQGIDPLDHRIAIARARTPGIPFAVGRAEDLRAFGDQTFDGVCMAAVFHWVEDKARALSEVFRVLRPGGLVGLTSLPRELYQASTMARVTGPVLERSPFKERLTQELSEVPSRGVSLTELVGLMLDTGFEVVKLIVAERKRIHPDEHAVIDFVESSSFGNFLGMVSEDLRAELRYALAAEFRKRRRTEEGIEMREHGVIAVARRPPR